MSVEDTIDGLAIIQQKRGRIVDQGDVEMLAQAIRELRKGRPGTVRAEVAQPEESAASQLLRKVRREWYSFTPYCTLKAEIDALLDGPHG